MTYAYARVSTKEQNEARQIAAFKAAGIGQDSIFVDHESGKDFNRTNYKKIRGVIRAGDLLVVHSLDRFGRNYDMIIDEWRYLTKTVGADVRVLDMPILDTTQGTGLVGKFISDIVLQILSFVAENERTKIRERQAQGIKAAKERGVKFGRPRIYMRTPALERAEKDVANGVVSIGRAAVMCGMSMTTFRRRLKEDRVVSRARKARSLCCDCPKCKDLYCPIFAKRVRATDKACEEGRRLIRNAKALRRYYELVRR